MQIRFLVSISILLVVTARTTNAQSTNTSLPLIPAPRQLEMVNGSFPLPGKTLTFFAPTNKALLNAVTFIQQELFGLNSKRVNKPEAADLRLLMDPGVVSGGYALSVSGKGIVLKASEGSGFLYGLQTLQQLYLLAETPGNRSLPYITIKDHPAFAWRGVELDVARHFFSKSYLYKFIDLLAAYKFNKLHLHLTDDQGWRIEIRKYPKLTAQGAWRSLNDQDSACLQKAKENPDFNLPGEFLTTKDGKQVYGGFYTQQDIRDIVHYAAQKHIEVIPEIDMPGHMMVATRAYPELLLDNVTPGWGNRFSVPICPCKESTYTFIENVLTEVMALFPSKYIHIGADEVEKKSWEQSGLCQQWINQQKTTDVHGLQSLFIKRINQFIRSKGRTAIGWDEILEGPSDPSMVVMYWRGWEKNAPYEAVHRQHPVIMTPTNPMYFDYLPNSSTLDNVYHFDVLPATIPADKKHLVWGGQANIWTEMIPSRERLEFMILPRLSALAERLWTNRDLFDTYQQRLIKHYAVWDKKGLRYRMPDLSGFADEQVLVDGKAVLTVKNPLANTSVHYTVDGTLPTLNSSVLKDTLTFFDTTRVRFAAISRSGARSELYQVNIKKGHWAAASAAGNTAGAAGLQATLFKGSFANTTQIKGEPIRKEVISNVHLSDTIQLPAFGAKMSGYLRVPQKGIYSFYFTCDDGGVLTIANQVVINNDGQHAPVMKSGQIALEAGYHPFHIDFIEAGGGFTLKLQYSVDGSPIGAIPDNWFYNNVR